MKKRTKILIITSSVVLSLIILSIVGLFIFISKNNSPEDFEEKILPKLEEKIDGEISYSEVKLSVFPTQEIDVEDFKITSTDKKNEITIDNLKLGLSFLDLIFGDIRITRIEAVGGNIPIVRTYEGKITIGGSIPEAGSSFEDMEYEGEVNLKDTRLMIMGIGEERLELSGVDLRSNVELKKDEQSKFFGDLSWEDISLISDDNPSPFSSAGGSMKLNARFYPDRKQIEMTNCDLTVNDQKFGLSATISDIYEQQPHLSLELNSESTNLEKLVGILSKKRYPVLERVSIKGKMDLNLQIEGRVPAYGRMVDLETDGEIDIYEGEVRSLGGSGGEGEVKDIRTTGIFNGQSLTFKKIELKSDYGKILGNLRIPDLQKPRIITNLKGDFDAGLIASLFGAKADWKVKGEGRGELRIDGTLDELSHLDFEGDFNELNGEFSLPIFKEPVKVKRGNLEIDGNRLNVENILLELGDDRLKLEGELEGFKYPQIEYRVWGDSLDLEKLLVKGIGSGKGEKPDEYTTTMKGEYEIKKVKLWGISARDFEARTLYRDGIVKFDRLQFDAYSGSLDGTASILVPERSYTFSIMAEDVDIGKYLTDNTDYKDVIVGGRLTVDMIFSGKGITKDSAKEHLRGEGILDYRDGMITKLTVLDRFAEWSHLRELKDLFVDEISASFIIGDGGINVRECEITTRDIKKAIIKGWIGFDENVDIYGEVRLTEEATEKYEQVAIGLSLDEDGCGALAFHLTGKTTAPTYQLDPERTSQLATDNVGGLSETEEMYFGE